MIPLPELDDGQRFKLTEVHRLITETHAAVIRLETTHVASHDVLKRIETNTATVAQFFEQLDTVTKLAAGKNQIPASFVMAIAVLIAVYIISNNLKDSNMDVKIPWMGIEILHGDSHGGK